MIYLERTFEITVGLLLALSVVWLFFGGDSMQGIIQ